MKSFSVFCPRFFAKAVGLKREGNDRVLEITIVSLTALIRLQLMRLSALTLDTPSL